MCYTLIDKLEKAAAANIATVGYQTLFSVLANGSSEKNYAGTKAEADAIVSGTTVNVSENSDDSNPVALDKQYIKARTQAGTKTAYLEIVLTKPYIVSIALPDGLTRTVDLLTLPSNSKA